MFVDGVLVFEGDMCIVFRSQCSQVAAFAPV